MGIRTVLNTLVAACSVSIAAEAAAQEVPDSVIPLDVIEVNGTRANAVGAAPGRTLSQRLAASASIVHEVIPHGGISVDLAREGRYSLDGVALWVNMEANQALAQTLSQDNKAISVSRSDAMTPALDAVYNVVTSNQQGVRVSFDAVKQGISAGFLSDHFEAGASAQRGEVPAVLPDRLEKQLQFLGKTTRMDVNASVGSNLRERRGWRAFLQTFIFEQETDLLGRFNVRRYLDKTTIGNYTGKLELPLFNGLLRATVNNQHGNATLDTWSLSDSTITEENADSIFQEVNFSMGEVAFIHNRTSGGVGGYIVDNSNTFVPEKQFNGAYGFVTDTRTFGQTKLQGSTRFDWHGTGHVSATASASQPLTERLTIIADGGTTYSALAPEAMRDNAARRFSGSEVKGQRIYRAGFGFEYERGRVNIFSRGEWRTGTADDIIKDAHIEGTTVHAGANVNGERYDVSGVVFWRDLNLETPEAQYDAPQSARTEAVARVSATFGPQTMSAGVTLRDQFPTVVARYINQETHQQVTRIEDIGPHIIPEVEYSLAVSDWFELRVAAQNFLQKYTKNYAAKIGEAEIELPLIVSIAAEIEVVNLVNTLR